MYWESALSSSIEIGIALMGFSGIVAALHSRSDQEWSPDSQNYLEILLAASGNAIVFSMLPFIFLGQFEHLDTGWRVFSATFATTLIAVFVFRSVRVRRIGATMSPLVSIFIVVAAVLVAFNAFYVGEAWLYLLSVGVYLGIAMVSFTLLLFNLQNRTRT